MYPTLKGLVASPVYNSVPFSSLQTGLLGRQLIFARLKSGGGRMLCCCMADIICCWYIIIGFMPCIVAIIGCCIVATGCCICIQLELLEQAPWRTGTWRTVACQSPSESRVGANWSPARRDFSTKLIAMDLAFAMPLIGPDNVRCLWPCVCLRSRTAALTPVRLLISSRSSHVSVPR